MENSTIQNGKKYFYRLDSNTSGYLGSEFYLYFTTLQHLRMNSF